MGLTEFLAGWALGSKAGHRGFDDVVDSARGLIESKEFHDLVDVTRSHLSFALGELSKLVATDDDNPPSEDLVEIVRSLRAKRDMWPPWRS